MQPGNLAEPVQGHLDADGRLISADPLLLRLHLHCGGYEGGPLAIPQLANLCRLSRQLKMNLSRAVKAADDENTIYLWAETQLEKDDLTLVIRDWKETPLSDSGRDDLDRQRDFDRLQARGSLRTDASLRIISVTMPRDFSVSENYAGQSILEVFDFLPPSKQSALIEAISERQPIRGQRVRQKTGKKELYNLSGQPLINNDGLFSGYRFSLEHEASEDEGKAEPSTSNLISDSLFGSQLGPALRQPLGKIIANAETIGSRLEGPLRGDYAGYAKDIASAGRHLMDLVDDLSDLEAIERTTFSVAKDEIDLIDLAYRAAGLLAVKASDHQIRIDLPSKETQMPAQGEFRRVLQILVNLIGNAIRYSPDGSVIKLSVKAEGDMASIIVTDQGDGIALEDQSRIFEKFERLGRSGDGGSGLGLFISRRLANAMGGSLTVESKPDQGASFKLSVPARKPE